MEDLIMRLQLRSTIQEYIMQLMAQNNITATQMEDALNHVMLLIKDAVLSDYAVYAEQFYTKDKMDSMQNLIQSYADQDNQEDQLQVIEGEDQETSGPVYIEE